MPTRESERSRREVVIEGELAAALHALHVVRVVEGHVSLPTPPREVLGCRGLSEASSQVLLILACSAVRGETAIGEAPDACLTPELANSIQVVTNSVVGRHELKVLWTRLEDVASHANDTESVWNSIIQLLVALALGASAGVAIERRRRARRKSPYTTFNVASWP